MEAQSVTDRIKRWAIALLAGFIVMPPVAYFIADRVSLAPVIQTVSENAAQLYAAFISIAERGPVGLYVLLAPVAVAVMARIAYRSKIKQAAFVCAGIVTLALAQMLLRGLIGVPVGTLFVFSIIEALVVLGLLHMLSPLARYVGVLLRGIRDMT